MGVARHYAIDGQCGVRDGRPLHDLPEQQALGAPSKPAQERVQEVRDRVLRRAGPQAARDMAAALPHLQRHASGDVAG